MYILFGSGAYGKQCMEFIGKSNVRYIVDNNEEKRDINAAIPVYTFTENGRNKEI